MDVVENLIQAIHKKRLAQTAGDLLDSHQHDGDEQPLALLHAAIAICACIRAICEAERDAVSRHLKQSGIDHCVDESELDSPQIHQFSITIERDSPREVAALLANMGFRCPMTLNDIQWEVLRRTTNELVLTKVDEVTMRLRLKWSGAIPIGVQARLWPNIDDAALVPFSAASWWFAFAARPFGIVLRRLGLMRSQRNIGEFLGTPEELVPALLEFAGVCSDDVIYDLGCGDGRILISAARLYSCQAVGYEYDASLCQVARSRAAEQGVGDLVEIRHEDVMAASIDEASVVFLFQPPATVLRLLPGLLQRMPRGGRVIAHEQSQVITDLPPQKSQPLFGSSSLTVAHLWSTDQL